jgi:hypothetical protein
MIDTERSPETTERLRDEIMRERAEGLREAAQAAQARLVEREEALARLRVQVEMIKASLAPAPVVQAAAPAAVRMAPILVSAKEASVGSARTTGASLPRTASWRSLAPYAAIVACAVVLELGGGRRPAPVAPNLIALAHPAPAVVANARPAAKGAPVVTDDDRSQEALLLVHEWKLPGDAKSLGERLGSELEIPGGRPSWSVERIGMHGYRVTFQPAEKDLPYAFEADIESRVVWPTPETQELLAPRFTAAFRDAVR